ncbi:MAG: substrate-binding domain-containing protein [Acidobacteriota bacterium]
MSKHILLHPCAFASAAMLLTLTAVSSASAQAPACVPPAGQHLIIYRAGSLTAAFKPLIAAFTCQTGIEVKDVAMGSVDAGRQITAGGQACDLYAPADYSVIDEFLKPAGHANFTIVFARGKMVLAYSAKSVALKNLPPIAEAGGQSSTDSSVTPNASPTWYQILTMPGVAIGGGHPFLDPGAYRADMIFQLAQAYYKVPNLYNNLLEHLVITGPALPGAALGDRFDFQFSYEHSVRAMARANPDVRYVNLPSAINLSDPAKDEYYRQHAVVVLPGLGTPRSAQSIAVPGIHVAWGITLLKDAPNREHAIKFLELLLSPVGTAMLESNGPAPVSPALVSQADVGNLPASLRAFVKTPGS